MQLSDSMTLALLKNSSLTATQFETFLIEALSKESSEETFSGEEKTYFRKNRAKITRGAYNRTLRQARRNIIQALYTVFLLGYTELFDTPELQPFIETASRIRAYTAQHRTSKDGQNSGSSSDIPAVILEDLRQTIERLAKDGPEDL